jgi:hypothetical protein
MLPDETILAAPAEPMAAHLRLFDPGAARIRAATRPRFPASLAAHYGTFAPRWPLIMRAFPEEPLRERAVH